MGAYTNYEYNTLNEYYKNIVNEFDSTRRNFPESAQGRVWYHGLCTCNSEMSFIKALNGVKNILGSDKEISVCKGQHVAGQMGIIVKGICSYMCSTDCGSFVVDGKRYPKAGAQNDVSEYDELDESESYTESFVSPTEITGGWVKKEILDRYNNPEFLENWSYDEDLYEFYKEESDSFFEGLEALKALGVGLVVI